MLLDGADTMTPPARATSFQDLENGTFRRPSPATEHRGDVGFLGSNTPLYARVQTDPFRVHLLLPPVLPAHATYPGEHGRSRPHASQEAVIRVNHLGLSGDGVDAGGLRRRLGQPDSYNALTRRVLDAFERQYLARQEART
jgi:hypothetical protein